MTKTVFKTNGQTCKRCSKYWEKYKIRVTDYDKMYDSQNGECAICKTSNAKTSTGNFCVDHCHTTGKVRGLLCVNCNVGIGSLKESPEIFSAALNYLNLSDALPS